MEWGGLRDYWVKKYVKIWLDVFCLSLDNFKLWIESYLYWVMSRVYCVNLGGI